MTAALAAAEPTVRVATGVPGVPGLTAPPAFTVTVLLAGTPVLGTTNPVPPRVPPAFTTTAPVPVPEPVAGLLTRRVPPLTVVVPP